MRNLFIILFITCSATVSFGQQDEQMSIYMYNPLYYNPAYAGSRDAISAVAVGRFQWINFDGAPNSQWFSIHAPLLFKSLGIGAHMVNDQIGKRNRTAAFVDVSTSIKLNKEGSSRLAAGLSGGMDVMGYDFSNMLVTDVNDPYYGKQVSFTKPNFGAGLYYYGNRHYVGISAPRIIENRLDNTELIEILNARHYFISAGYVFDLNSVLKLKPSTLIKYTPHAPITADINLSLLSYEKLWTGIMYRYNESAGANIAYTFKQFTVGYVYDFPINGLMNQQSGSHEVFLQLDVKPKNTSFTSPRYF